ncbi:MAG: pre-peptidase C-terminal domain-containing protein [Bacteroidota bacterium]
MKLRITLLTLICAFCWSAAFTQGSFCSPSDIANLSCQRRVFATTKNAGNDLNRSDYGSCVAGSNISYDGNDVVFRFIATTRSLVVNVGGFSTNLDVFVFDDCSSSRRCIARWEAISSGVYLLNLPSTGTYYLAVDSKNAGAATDFTIYLDCRRGQDDEDDCETSACNDAHSISCGQEIQSTTLGKANKLNRECNYGSHCTNGYDDYEAGDRVFKINVPSGTDKLDIKLSGLHKNLDLFVFRNSCSLNRCVASSQRSSTNDESITIDDPSGTYFIIVDGARASDESNFRLKVSCEEDNKLKCDNLPRLECDRSYYLSNSGEGNDLEYADYGSCVSHLNRYHYPYHGQDVVYKIYIDEGQGVDILMSDLHDNLDMFFYKDCSSYWNTLSGCLARSINDGNHDERIKVEHLPRGYYYLAIDGRNTYDVSNFRLKIDCTPACEPVIDKDCDDLDFHYIGNSHELEYQFKVPNHYPSGYWTVASSTSSQTFQSGKHIEVKFSRATTYTVCYNYVGQDGCDYKCCKTIRSDDPNDCDKIEVEETNSGFKLSVPSYSHKVISWRNVSTDEHLGGGQSIQVAAPPAGTCQIFEALLEDGGVYRYCRVKVCSDNENPLQWLDDLIADLEACCEEFSEALKVVQRGKLNGETVYTVPDCATADGFLTLYDAEGNVICQEGGFAGLVCDELADVTDLTTIFECGSPNLITCIDLSNQLLTCDEDGIIIYTATVSNNTDANELFLEFEVSSESEVKFANCSIRNTFLIEGDEQEIKLELKNCGEEALEPGTPVQIEIKVDGVDNCEPTLVNIGVSECNGCTTAPLNDGVCTEEFDPVCGCDGVTYSNACKAAAAGVNLWFKGECPTPGADLSLSLSTDVVNFGLYEKVPFKVSITNDGPEATSNVAVSIPLPVTAAYTSSAADKGDYRVVAEVWEVGDLAVGESAELEFVAFALSINTPITLYAQVVTSDRSDPDSSPNNGNENNIAEDDEASMTIMPAGTANLSSNNSGAALDNYPNPFSKSTTIQFQLMESQAATLTVFDLNGRAVFSVSRMFEQGFNQIEFERTARMARGLYYYRLQTSDQILTKSMLLE